MTLALKVCLVSGAYATSKWEGVIEIASSSTLEELHFAIQDALRFDDDHLYEFFCARTERSRDRISLDDENGALYEQTIESLFPLREKQNLYYLFDYGDCWIFKVTKAKALKLPPDCQLTHPRLVHEIGDKPIQYPFTEE